MSLLYAWATAPAWADGLPEPAALALWLRVGWGVVLGALVFHALQRLHRPWTIGQRTASWPALAGAAVALNTLVAPGAWSAAHWLGLAFQAPSGVLVALCAASVQAVWSAARPTTLPLPLAASLAVAGAALYASHLAWLPLDLYALGFAPAPALGLSGAAAVLSLGLAWRGHRAAAWSLALALGLHAALRLPTGNAWDALLDPWLWAWAVATCLGRAGGSSQSAAQSAAKRQPT